MESDIYLAIVYVSPITSPYSSKREDIFDLVEADIAKFSKLGKCLVGVISMHAQIVPLITV